MYNRDKLHRQAKLTGSPQTWNKYKTARNKVTSLIRKSKKAHYANQLNNSKSKTKDIWCTLKELLPNKMSVNSPAIKDPQLFDNYFSSVANELTKDFGPVTLPLFNTDHVTTKFDFLTINVNSILKELLDLPIKTGLDIIDMDHKLLRLSSPIISPIITGKLQKSLPFSKVKGLILTLPITGLFQLYLSWPKS